MGVDLRIDIIISLKEREVITAKKEIEVPCPHSSSAGFWRKVILVLKVILRYGRLKFFLWSRNKAPRKAFRWP